MVLLRRRTVIGRARVVLLRQRSWATLMLVFLHAGAGAAVGQQGPVFRTVGWRHLFEPGPADAGIGIVAFAWPNPPAAPDSLPLYRRPGERAPAGHFVFEPDGSGGWTYAITWPESLSTNLLEFGYELAGLPFDSATADERWLRVIPGFDPSGSPRFAWVEPAAAADSLEIIRWDHHLSIQDLYFRAGVTPVFFDAPGGQPVAFPLPEERVEYILHPLERRGDWLLVRAVTPSDYCDAPESPRRAELWIRYLDPTGRPLAWYATRGC
jgi:hypothetical protein